MSGSPDPTERIAAIFRGVLDREVPSVETDLFETGVLDSLAFVELLLQLEREYGVTTSVEDLDADNFRTIARIALFVGERTPAHSRVLPFRASV